MNSDEIIDDQGIYSLDRFATTVIRGIDHVIYNIPILTNTEYNEINRLEDFFRENIKLCLRDNEKEFLSDNVIFDHTFFIRFYVYDQEKLYNQKLHRLRKHLVIESPNSAITLRGKKDTSIDLKCNFLITKEGFISKKRYFNLVMIA